MKHFYLTITEDLRESAPLLDWQKVATEKVAGRIIRNDVDGQIYMATFAEHTGTRRGSQPWECYCVPVDVKEETLLSDGGRR
jgi:hypothetical protein